MSVKNKAGLDALDGMVGGVVDGILSASDSEIIAEVRERYGDEATFVADVDDVFHKAIYQRHLKSGGVAEADATAHRLSEGATLSGKSVQEARLTSASGSRTNVREAMLAAVPSLRAFAISLCGNVDRADDLVQEALLRARANMGSFQPGTNMSAWLFTILRNLFRSEYRKRRREVEGVDGSYAESLTSLAGQNSRLEMVENALKLLPSEQRESLILVGASGFSYEEAAQICGCAVGTIKSRVNRARSRLAEILAIDSASDVGPEEKDRTAIKPSLNGSREIFLNRK
jgi:RNA polymerase sigma-70 factor, ECF subfamily